MGDNLSQDQDRLLSAIKAELEQMRLDQRGPSRIGTPAPTAANIVKKITQTAHGFAIGDTVVLVGATWVLTDASSSGNVTRDSVVGVVGKISDVDNFLCVFYGAMCVPGLSTSYVLYFLDTATPGFVTHTRPTTGVRYSIFSSLGDDLVWVDPGHSVSVMDDLDDVVVTSVADGDILVWQTSSSRWVNAAPGAAALPSIAGLSVLGRASNSSGVVAAITAVTDGHVLRLSGTTLGFGQIATAGYADASITYAKIQNVTGMSVVGNGTSSLGVPGAILAGADGDVLRRSGTTVAFGTITSLSMDAVIVAGGPTGSASVVPVITYDAAGRLTAVTTATITPAAIGAVDTATFSAHTHSLTGDVGGTTAATVIGANKVLDTMIRQGTALTVIGRSANSTGNVADIAAGTDGFVLRRSGTTLAFGLLTLTDNHSDVVITSVANLDFLRYDGSHWVNANLGRMIFTDSGTTNLDEFALDGGSLASEGTIVELGKLASRFMLLNGTSIDFNTGGTISGGTETNARIKFNISTGDVEFRDQAGAGTGTGTLVLGWRSTSTVANRKFQFNTNVDVLGGATSQFSIGGGSIRMDTVVGLYVGIAAEFQGAISITTGGSSIDSANGYKVGGNLVVTARQLAVTAPTGGATIDSQARTAINTIITRLQAHGLIS